jgi:hypothetical protein
MRAIIGFAVSLLLVCTACDTSERLARLEKQNQQLQEKVNKQQTVTDYDLQEKCSRDAKAWFHENWQADNDTTLLTYSNHYQKAMNKCFILVEYHYNSKLAGPGGSSWTNRMELWDVIENNQYADFGENHYTYYKLADSSNGEVVICSVSGQQCKSLQEFNSLIAPYAQ